MSKSTIKQLASSVIGGQLLTCLRTTTIISRTATIGLAATVGAALVSSAQAHTTSIGYEVSGPGAVNFWYGTYHGSNFNEGSLKLEGQDVSYLITVPFTLLVHTKPTGLVDGVTNFYADMAGGMTGTDQGFGESAWQGASFTGLTAGTYRFTYIPIAHPTADWDPIDVGILSNTFTLTAEQLGSTPKIDQSQAFFTQVDAPLSESPVVFAGGTFAPTADWTVAEPVTLEATGGTIDTSNGNVVVSGAMTGDGGLTKTGAGTLVLGGANSYAGGTTVSGGTLVGSTTSLQGTIANNANLVFDQASDGSFTGTISGTGSLVKRGGGTLTLGGTTTYSGTTTVSEGTLALGHDNQFDSNSSVAVAGGTLQLGSHDLGINTFSLSGGTLAGTGKLTAATYTLAGGTIDADLGNGALVQTSGTTTLNGNSGATSITVEGGSLFLNGTTTGDIAINGGSLVLGADDRVTVNNKITLGAAGGTFDLAGTSQSIGGLTGVAGSTIELGAGHLTVAQAENTSFAGSIAGTGSFTKSGSGTLTLTGANSYTGGTTIEGGTLVGNTTSLKGSIVNNGTLQFDQASDGSFGGVISGTGSLVKTGDGVLTLTGANSYTGGTTISGGTVVAGNADALGTGPVTFNGGTLRFAYSGLLNRPTTVETGVLTLDSGSNTVAINSPYSGDGGLTKTGSGTLNLTGNSTITGATTVLAGRLAVNGSLAASTATVLDSAVIGGNGTVGGLIVRRNATAAPGNSIGRLNVATFAVFEPGSFYEVEVDAAGNNDRLAVTSTATIQGGTVQVLAEQGTYQPATNYTILTADGGVSGQFAGVTSNLAFLTPFLSYGANAVTLTLLRNDLSFASAASTANQASTGAAIDRTFRFGSPVYTSLIGASAAQARDAFDQLSGEAHASAITSAVADAQLVRETLLNRTRQDVGNVSDRFALWGQALGSWGNTDGNGNAAQLDRQTEGFLIGGEAKLGDSLWVGVAAGHTATSFDVDARLSSGDIDAVHAGIYGGAGLGALQLRAGFGYASLDLDVDRSVGFGGFADRLTASYDGSTVQTFAEAGYKLDLGKLSLEPFAGLAAMWVTTDAFAEQGGSAALNGYGRDRDLAFSTLGLRTAARFGERSPLAVHATAGWRRAFDEIEPTALFAFRAGVDAFTVSGAPVDRDSLVLDAGLDWRIGNRVAIGVSYAGAVGKRAEDHGVKGSLTFSF